MKRRSRTREEGGGSPRIRIAALAGAIVVATAAVVACSSDPNGSQLGGLGNANGSNGDGSGGGGGGGGSDGSAGGGDGATTGPTCSTNDFVTQKQCGGGLACDLDRNGPGSGNGGGGGSDAGGGGGDGGREGGGDGGHEGGGGGDGGRDAGHEGGGGGMDSGGGGGGGMGAGGVAICRVATASGTEGVGCTPTDPAKCAAGLTCVGAACQKFCDIDTQCTSPGGACRSVLVGLPGHGPLGKTCSLDCDPLTAARCAPGQSCNLALTSDRSRLYTDCIAAGTGASMDPCTQASDCKAGLSCLKLTNNGQVVRQVCLQACARPPAANACPTGLTCVAIPPPNTLGGKEYGWCYTG